MKRAERTEKKERKKGGGFHCRLLDCNAIAREEKRGPKTPFPPLPAVDDRKRGGYYWHKSETGTEEPNGAFHKLRRPHFNFETHFYPAASSSASPPALAEREDRLGLHRVSSSEEQRLTSSSRDTCKHTQHTRTKKEIRFFFPLFCSRHAIRGSSAATDGLFFGSKRRRQMEEDEGDGGRMQVSVDVPRRGGK